MDGFVIDCSSHTEDRAMQGCNPSAVSTRDREADGDELSAPDEARDRLMR
jgi:hypothetical protein